MENITQVEGRIYDVSYPPKPSVDVKFGPYADHGEALAELGPNGKDCICAGLHYGIKNADGSVTEHVFIDSSGLHEEFAANAKEIRAKNVSNYIKATDNGIEVQVVSGKMNVVTEDEVPFQYNGSEVVNRQIMEEEYQQGVSRCNDVEAHIAKVYEGGKRYNYGDLVIIGGKLYECNFAHHGSSSPIMARWTSINIDAALGKRLGYIFKVWDAGVNYAKNDVVLDGGRVFVAKKDLPQDVVGVSNTDNWQEYGTLSALVSAVILEFESVVYKEAGKGLSANDFSNSLKKRLEEDARRLKKTESDISIRLALADENSSDISGGFVDLKAATMNKAGLMTAFDKTNLDNVVSKFVAMQSVESSNFIGIYETEAQADANYKGVPSWALIGSNLSSLLLRTYSNNGQKQTWSDRTYDFTNFAESCIVDVEEEGFFVIDGSNNIGAKVTSNEGFVSKGTKTYERIE